MLPVIEKRRSGHPGGSAALTFGTRAHRARFFLPLCLYLFVASRSSSIQEQIPAATYTQAAEAFEQGRLAEAEQTLRGALAQYPHEPHALGMLGVVLDAQKRYPEAEQCYIEALKLEPRSSVLLNNLGNHYVVQGKSEQARQAYLRVVGIDPHQPNASLHLAEMSVEARDGKTALNYLDQLPSEVKLQPSTELLRAQALHLQGQTSAAENLLDHVQEQAAGDPRVPFSIGMMFVEWKLYSRAEQALSLALKSAPANFEILYNLGLAAALAGHLDRAEEAFEAALRQKRDDVDSLYNLSRVDLERGRLDEAAALLVEAERLAPKRADILLSLAHVTEKLGLYGDSAEVYNKYLNLDPSDDVARRERGFALARSAKLEDALPDLRWYAQKYPKDAAGLYELAVAETVHERDQAIEHLNQAVALDPTLVPARYARAMLNYQQGKPTLAVEDLEFILKREPGNYQALDTLGEVDLALNRLPEAEAALRRAADLAPRHPTILVHYGRALQKAGKEEEAEKVLASLKTLPPQLTRPRSSGGLLNLLGSPNGPQKARYLASLQSELEANPRDVNLEIELGKTLLSEGKTTEALNAYRRVRGLTSDPKTYASCGKTLLDYEQYGPAREFLQDAVAGDPSSMDIRLDLVVAVFHLAGPVEALAELDRKPPIGGKGEGDYYLLRAQILDAMGKTAEAVDNLNRGFRASPTRADLYFQAALFLIKHGRYQEALNLIQQAGPLVPNAPQLRIAEAIVYEVSQRSDQAEKVLEEIQNQWPEWSPPYLLNGVILESHFKSAEAKSQLETALALGGDDATAYYYLALAHTQTSPQNIAAAEKAVQQALRLNPNNAHARSLAGKIAFLQKQYSVARDYLVSAIRLEPDFVDAHEALSGVYRALGEKQKSIDELKEVLAIKQKKAGTSQSPATISDLLFTVRPPAEDASTGVP